MVQKLPMTTEELDKLEAIACSYPKDSDHYRTFLLLRYTGMHVCCLYRKESRIREMNIHGHTYIRWYRPMKGKIKGVKNLWEILPGIVKHNKIDFDVEAFYNHIVKRKRKKGNMYFYRIMKEIGAKSGLPDVSPNTLRHSLAVYLIEDVKLSYENVANILGCSILTLHKHYAKVSKKEVDKKLIEAGW